MVHVFKAGKMCVKYVLIVYKLAYSTAQGQISDSVLSSEVLTVRASLCTGGMYTQGQNEDIYLLSKSMYYLCTKQGTYKDF